MFPKVFFSLQALPLLLLPLFAASVSMTFEVMKNTLFIALAALGYFLTRTADDLTNKLKYSFDRVSASLGSNIQSSVVRARMTITNPTNSSLRVNNITGSLVYNGASVGNVQIDKSFSISPQASVQVPVVATVSNISLFGKLANSILHRQGPVVKLTGFINTTLGAIPFTYSFKLEMPNAGGLLKDIFNRPTVSV